MREPIVLFTAFNIVRIMQTAIHIFSLIFVRYSRQVE